MSTYYFLCEYGGCNVTATYRIKRGMDEPWLRVCDVHAAVFRATPDHAIPEIIRLAQPTRRVQVARWYAGPRVQSAEGTGR